MSLDFSAKNRLVQHLACLDVPHNECIRFSNLISRWCSKSGCEWTVKRLKNLQESHKQLLQTGSYQTAVGWCTRVNRKKQVIYKDRLVHRMMTKTNCERKLKQQLVFFRLHEVIKLPKLTRVQYEKWKKGVLDPYYQESTVRSEVEELMKSIDNMKIPKPKNTWKNFSPLVYQPVRERTSPIFEDGSVKTAVRSNNKVFTLEPLRNSLWYNLVQRYPSCVAHCITGSENEDALIKRVLKLGPTESNIGGSIGFIQEKSAKLRAVASPFLVFQAMGEPAKLQLDRLSRRIKEMHTHSQDESKQLVSDALLAGRKVHGFDASAFTDRLPFDLQIRIVKKLVREGWLSEFDHDSIECMIKSDWSVGKKQTERFGDTSVRWNVGQPMGYGPSFHLAALTHYMIVRSCAERVGAKYNNEFVVVGDDVSIFNCDIATEYYRTMTALGVDINMEKSVSSNEIAEFCKKVILPGTVIESITVQDNLYQEDAIVTAVGFYGKKLLRFMTKDQLRKADKILLPRDLGGLGMSPDTVKYRQYLEDILNTKSIQRHRLRKEIDDFLGKVDKDALKFSLATIAERYNFWSSLEAYSHGNNDCELFISLFGLQNVTSSEWTGLPVLKMNCYSASTADRTGRINSFNNFRTITDYSLMNSLAGSSQSENRQKCIEVIQELLLDQYGFILTTEKASLIRPIKVMENNYNVENDKEEAKPSDKQPRRSFSRNYLRRRVKSLKW